MTARKLAALLVIAPSLALACSLIQRPTEVESLGNGRTIPVLIDGGADATAPTKPVVSGLRVTLVRNGCDGAGAACPQLDSLQFVVATGDAVTPTERLRYVAAFGASAADASSAEFSLLFKADPTSATSISSWLGLAGRRSGAGFDRQSLCFVVAAVDEAANVSARSEAVCVDTTDTRAATSNLVQGAPCGGLPGCGCGGAGGAEALLALLVVAWLIRR